MNLQLESQKSRYFKPRGLNSYSVFMQSLVEGHVVHCFEGELGGNCWEGSHAYNKGRNTVLVVSQVPLPNYRADLDDRHGSSQRQVGSLPLLYHKHAFRVLTPKGPRFHSC